MFKHRSVLGNARSQDLFKLVQVAPKQGVKAARSYDDYIVDIDRADLPEGVEIVERPRAAMAPARRARSKPIPLSALQHAVDCLRQAALIHLERLWDENRFTAAGHVLHVAADKPGGRRVRGVRRVTALAIGSPARSESAGVADLAELREERGGQVPFPVEYKRGKPKLHRADEVQLCAQALRLEDMTGKAVPVGALFYAETKRRRRGLEPTAIRQR